MRKRWANASCICLAAAWSGCALAPSPEHSVSAGEDTTPSIVVAKLDSGVDRLDASGSAPADAAAAEDGSEPPSVEPGRSEADPVPDASGWVTLADAQQAEAGLPGADAGEDDDAGSKVPAEPVDAGAHDAGKVGCLPGTYVGSFEGEISALLGAIRIEVAGDITIDVELSGTVDRLTVRKGVLQGTDTSADKNPLFARIGGVLNCATKKLERGTITDGTYNRVDPIWGGPPTTTTFSGTIAGIYSTNPPAAVGTWMVENATGTRQSMGTWNAALR